MVLFNMVTIVFTVSIILQANKRYAEYYSLCMAFFVTHWDIKL